MAILLRIGAFLLGLYLLAMLAMFLLQSRLIYHPDTRALTPQQAGLAGFSAVHIKTGDLTLTSWWHPPSGDGQPVIVYMHGNGGALAGRAALYRELAASGAGVLAVGYPGYGGNPGKPSEESLVDAASYNYAWLAEQGYPDARIVIAGQSLGTRPRRLAGHPAQCQRADPRSAFYVDDRHGKAAGALFPRLLAGQ